jgi:hypothetical protein
MTFRTLAEVKAANTAAGGSFFDKSHRTAPVSRRIYPTDHGAVIVSSSPARDDYRHWLVWWSDSATGAITPAESGFPSDTRAHSFARDLARLDGWGNKRAPKRDTLPAAIQRATAWDGGNHVHTPVTGSPYCGICGGTRAGAQHITV